MTVFVGLEGNEDGFFEFDFLEGVFGFPAFRSLSAGRVALAGEADVYKKALGTIILGHDLGKVVDNECSCGPPLRKALNWSLGLEVMELFAGRSSLSSR